MSINELYDMIDVDIINNYIKRKKYSINIISLFVYKDNIFCENITCTKCIISLDGSIIIWNENIKNWDKYKLNELLRFINISKILK